MLALYDIMLFKIRRVRKKKKHTPDLVLSRLGSRPSWARSTSLSRSRLLLPLYSLGLLLSSPSTELLASWREDADADAIKASELRL